MEKRSCYNCFYVRWSPGRWLRDLSTGWPPGPTCVNHPSSPGEMRDVLPGDVCRNWRPKLDPAGADPTRDAAARAKPVPPGADGVDSEGRPYCLIPLSHNKFALVDPEDYEWLSQWRWVCRGGGSPYAVRFEKGKIIWMHREIMKPPPGMIVDHVKNNTLNNCRHALRVCTRKQNVHNLGKSARGTSGYKGVFWDKRMKKWCAKIVCDGKQYYLGYFDDEAEAARAYDRKAVELFGEFARLNFPHEWPPERLPEVYATRDAGVRRGDACVARTSKSKKAKEGKRKKAKAKAKKSRAGTPRRRGVKR